MQIEIVWNLPGGGWRRFHHLQLTPMPPNKDDEELQIAKMKVAAQALLQQQLGMLRDANSLRLRSSRINPPWANNAKSQPPRTKPIAK